MKLLYFQIAHFCLIVLAGAYLFQSLNSISQIITDWIKGPLELNLDMNNKPLSAIRSFLKNRKERKAQKRRELRKQRQKQALKNEENFYSHGFSKVKFPILLVDGDLNEDNNIFEYYNYELTVVWDLSEFSVTGWYHSASMESEFKFIDNRGEIWDFKFNTDLGACTPGSLLKKLELNELKSFVIKCINWRDQDEVRDAIQKANSISSVFEVIEKYHKSFL